MLKKTFAMTAVGLGVLSAAAPATLAAGSSQLLVPYRSIGGLRLKWTPAQVRHHLGHPSATFRERGKISGYQYESRNLQVDFDIFDKRDRAQTVQDVDGPVHTIRGIHTGITVTALRHKLHGFEHFSCTKGIGCSISRGEPGADGSYQTSFGVSGGKVTGFAISYNYPAG
jgi:hypothetical protein